MTQDGIFPRRFTDPIELGRDVRSAATSVRRAGVIAGRGAAATAALCMVLATTPAASETYYVATDGSDASRGTIDQPFGTVEHATEVAGAGDTIHVRGGTYQLSRGIQLTGSGTPGHPIKLWAMAGETVILDFSDNPRHSRPPQPRDDDTVLTTSYAVGIHLAGDWWHLRGLTVQNAPYYGVRVYGSHNTLEQLTLRYNKASGLEITGKEGLAPGHNLVLNCDSSFNFDPQSNGEDADGFAAKFDSLGSGNVFRGLRSWSNSDDGYDFWNAAHTVVIESCWSFDNGFNRAEWAAQISGGWRGDGLGFKLGQDAAQLILDRVAAWGNKAFGIDENGNRSAEGVIIRNATLVNNAKDGNPVQISLDDGRPHTVTNTIAFDVDGTDLTSFSGAVRDTFNTWNGIGVSAADFENLDMARLYSLATGPRHSDGSLPDVGLRLAESSHLIDAGTDVGLPFNGPAPDLGAFEVPGDERAFLRGDCNDDRKVDISDAVFTLGSLFLGNGDPDCADACDSNDDGAVDISDAIATFGVLFLGDGVIPPPGATECGVDPTGDQLGCAASSGCR